MKIAQCENKCFEKRIWRFERELAEETKA